MSALRLRIHSEMPGLLEFVVVIILQYSHESLLPVVKVDPVHHGLAAVPVGPRERASLLV